MKSLAWTRSITVAATLFATLHPGYARAQDGDTWTDRIALKGDLRLRYEAIDEQGETDRKRGRYRARFGLSAEVDDDIHVVFQLATGGGDPVSTNQSFDDGFSTKDVGVDLAYVDWSANENMHIYGGKMKNPLFRPGGNALIWDSDLNPEGIALDFRSGMLFGTAGGFVVEERASADDSLLFVAQGGISLKLSDAGKLTAGIGYYDYSDTIGNEPFYDGSSNGNSVDVQGNLIFDYNERELFAQYETRIAELPFSVFVDFVQNSDPDVNDMAYAIGVKTGAASDPGTWEGTWVYQDVEADAVIGTFSESDFGGGGTDATGHILRAKYAINRSIALGATVFINKVDNNAGNEHKYSRLQLDLEFKFN